MNLTKPYHPGIKVFLVGLVTYFFLCFLLGPVCYEFNNYNLANQEESDRNYSVIQYHAIHDTSYHQYQGMNYPYGEQVIYAEGQPIISYTIKFLSAIFPNLAFSTVGIINFFVIINIVLSAIFIYLILLGLKIPWTWAFGAAVAIALLNPQNIRIPWQYPICPALVIPLSLYLIQKLILGYQEKTHRLILILCCVLNILFWFFINAYLGALALTISLFGALTVSLKYRSWRGLIIMGAMFIPAMIFMIYLKTTDIHINRPELSYGYLEYTSTIHSVFSSRFTPFSFIQSTLGFNLENSLEHLEGNGYLGVLGMLNMLVILIVLIRAQRQKIKLPVLFYLFLTIGGLTAVYAFGFPFTLFPSTIPYIEHLGPLKQLRSSGRFIWISYFTFQIITIYAIHFYYRSSQHWGKVFMKGYFLAFCILTILEGSSGLFWAGSKGKGVRNIYNPRLVANLPEFTSLHEALEVANSNKYQAILTVPFFHIGSELLRHPASGIANLMRHSMAFSVHSGLPLMSSCLGRISRDETLKAFQVYTEPIISKPIKKDLPQYKPILVLADRTVDWTPEEKALISRAHKIYTKNAELEVYEIDLEQLFEDHRYLNLENFLLHKDSYYAISEVLYAQDSSNYCYVESFEETGNTSVAYRGTKAQAIAPGLEAVIFNSQNYPTFNTMDSVIIRFWINNETNGADCRFKLKIYDKENRLVDNIYLLKAHTTFWHLDGWSMLAIPVMIRPRHRVELIGYTLSHHYPLIIDELMVASQKDAIYEFISEKHIRKNNVDIILNESN